MRGASLPPHRPGSQAPVHRCWRCRVAGYRLASRWRTRSVPGSTCCLCARSARRAIPNMAAQRGGETTRTDPAQQHIPRLEELEREELERRERDRDDRDR